MSALMQRLKSGPPVLMDGAMATALFRLGLGFEECPEAWNLTRPDLVRGLHEAYLAAGAEVLNANTFQANPQALARHGLQDRLEEINAVALRLAREAAGPGRFILADVGPLPPGWTEAELRRVAASLLDADGVLLETWSDPLALWAAYYVFAPLFESKPIFLSFTYQKHSDGLIATESGHPPRLVAELAKRYGVAALGVNCGRDLGLAEFLTILQTYRNATDLPLFVRPNAGNPDAVDNQLRFPHTEEEMAGWIPAMVRAGASMIGGCCGTGPAYIAGCRKRLDAFSA